MDQADKIEIIGPNEHRAEMVASGLIEFRRSWKGGASAIRTERLSDTIN
jgi:hypothetical protein